MKITSIASAENFLFGYIPQATIYKFPGSLGLDRTKKLLSLLGSPQNELSVVHIAGTSGKGSTAYLISKLLHAHGFRVGLHVSPHLTDIRERFQIDDSLISEKEFCAFLTQIIPAIDKIKRSRYGSPTYFEIITALAFYIFYKKKVNYAVVETGLGGWYDATNVVDLQNKLCILTRIGIDHTAILGNTLAKIALHKAHIIQKGNTVIMIRQKKAVQNVVEKFVKKQNAHLITVSKDTTLTLKPEGDFQKENASLAIRVLTYLSGRDSFRVDERKIRDVLLNMTIKGRFEIFEKNGKKIIIDGAHNPQKMSVFTKALKKKFPDRKFTFVVAFKEGKDMKGMLKYVFPLADKIICTQFWVNTTYSKVALSTNPEKIASLLNKFAFGNIVVEKNLEKALLGAFDDKNDVIITGSLYLLSEVYPKLT